MNRAESTRTDIPDISEGYDVEDRQAELEAGETVETDDTPDVDTDFWGEGDNAADNETLGLNAE